MYSSSPPPITPGSTPTLARFLENRAIKHAGKATLTLREDRNRDYLKGLTALIDDVAGGGV